MQSLSPTLTSLQSSPAASYQVNAVFAARGCTDGDIARSCEIDAVMEPGPYADQFDYIPPASPDDLTFDVCDSEYVGQVDRLIAFRSEQAGKIGLRHLFTEIVGDPESGYDMAPTVDLVTLTTPYSPSTPGKPALLRDTLNGVYRLVYPDGVLIRQLTCPLAGNPILPANWSAPSTIFNGTGVYQHYSNLHLAQHADAHNALYFLCNATRLDGGLRILGARYAAGIWTIWPAFAYTPPSGPMQVAGIPHGFPQDPDKLHFLAAGAPSPSSTTSVIAQFTVTLTAGGLFSAWPGSAPVILDWNGVPSDLQYIVARTGLTHRAGSVYLGLRIGPRDGKHYFFSAKVNRFGTAEACLVEPVLLPPPSNTPIRLADDATDCPTPCFTIHRESFATKHALIRTITDPTLAEYGVVTEYKYTQDPAHGGHLTLHLAHAHPRLMHMTGYQLRLVRTVHDSTRTLSPASAAHLLTFVVKEITYNATARSAVITAHDAAGMTGYISPTLRKTLRKNQLTRYGDARQLINWTGLTPGAIQLSTGDLSPGFAVKANENIRTALYRYANDAAIGLRAQHRNDAFAALDAPTALAFALHPDSREATAATLDMIDLAAPAPVTLLLLPDLSPTIAPTDVALNTHPLYTDPPDPLHDWHDSVSRTTHAYYLRTEDPSDGIDWHISNSHDAFPTYYRPHYAITNYKISPDLAVKQSRADAVRRRFEVAMLSVTMPPHFGLELYDQVKLNQNASPTNPNFPLVIVGMTETYKRGVIQQTLALHIIGQDPFG